MNKSLNSKEKESFNEFFADTLYEYMQEKKLCIKKFNKNFYNIGKVTYWLVAEKDFEDKSYEQDTEKKALTTNKEECLALIKEINILKTNSIRTLFVNDMFKYVYERADDAQKQIIVSKKLMISSISSIINSLKNENSKEQPAIKIFLNKYIKYYAKELTEYVEHDIEEIKKHLSSHEFNTIMLQWFSAASLLPNTEKKLLTIKFLLDKYIVDEDTYKNIITFFPNIVIEDKNKNIFIEEQNSFYEILINKNKLKSIVSFRDETQYKTMLQDISNMLQKVDVKNLLGIKAFIVSNEKKSSHISYLIKNKHNSNLNKEKMQDLLLKLFKDYHRFYMNDNDFNVKENLTINWLRNVKLSLELKENKREHSIKQKI